MNKITKRTALVLTAALAVSSMSVGAFAADNSLEGEASIGFTAGSTVIVPPDPGETDENMKKIKTTDIYFGEHEASSESMTIASRANAANPQGDQAGFIVSNPNKDPWEVKVAIGGFFDENDDDVLVEFEMDMTNELLVTTVDNEGAAAPTANNITIEPGTNGAQGDAITIMSATANKGVGKWGGNWSGELFVLPGRAQEGNGVAVMNWSLEVTPEA